MALNIRDYFEKCSPKQVAVMTKSKLRLEAFEEFVSAMAAMDRGKDAKVFELIGVLLQDEQKFGTNATMREIEEKLLGLQAALEGFLNIDSLLQANVGLIHNEEERSRILKYESLAKTFGQSLKDDLQFVKSRRKVNFKSGTQVNQKDIYLALIFTACRAYIEDAKLFFSKHYREFQGTSKKPKVTPVRLVTLVSIFIGDVRTEKAITQLVVGFPRFVPRDFLIVCHS